MVSDPFEPGLLRRLPRPPHKVVIVRASRIGDFICATPAFRALRTALPDAELALVGLPFVRDLVARSSSLDRFIEFPGFPGMAEQFFQAQRALSFFQAMQAERFDLAIQMNGSGVYANPFALLLGAQFTAGFVREPGWAQRLDAACVMPQSGNEVLRWLALTTFLGAPPQGDQTEFPLWEKDVQAAERMLAQVEPPLIGVHPAAREEGKRWPHARFARAVSELRHTYGGTVVVLGGPEERELAEALSGQVSGPCLNLAARTSLPETGALIARLALLLTNDSGPAHIAYALGTPSVTLFGDTDPARWGPLRTERHRVVVNTSPAAGQGVMGIEVAQVLEAAEAALSGAYEIVNPDRAGGQE